MEWVECVMTQVVFLQCTGDELSADLLDKIAYPDVRKEELAFRTGFWRGWESPICVRYITPLLMSTRRLGC